MQSAMTMLAPERVSLCEALDRVLDKGVYVGGELVVGIADVELVYVGLSRMIASVDTAFAPAVKGTKEPT